MFVCNCIWWIRVSSEFSCYTCTPRHSVLLYVITWCKSSWGDDILYKAVLTSKIYLKKRILRSDIAFKILEPLKVHVCKTNPPKCSYVAVSHVNHQVNSASQKGRHKSPALPGGKHRAAIRVRAVGIYGPRLKWQQELSVLGRLVTCERKFWSNGQRELWVRWLECLLVQEGDNRTGNSKCSTLAMWEGKKVVTKSIQVCCSIQDFKTVFKARIINICRLIKQKVKYRKVVLTHTFFNKNIYFLGLLNSLSVFLWNC